MAPLTRRNSALTRKIATLSLSLAPLVPLPSGPPHPSFPKTLLAFHLLTEDELDSIAHHYHQSTPGPWTQHYPALMNWDKEFLARPPPPLAAGKNSAASAADVDAALAAAAAPPKEEEEFLRMLRETVEDLKAGGGGATPPRQQRTLASSSSSECPDARNPYAGLSDKDRIRIKRRKVGKFIGLVGMETPVEEIAGRIQASLDRAVERSREEMRRNEEVVLRRRKVG